MTRKAYIPWTVGLPAVLGLIPFFAAAGLYAWGRPDQAGVALLTLLTYSAVSLSFLGGARWGHEAAQERPRAGIIAGASLAPLAGWLLLVTPIPEPKWQLAGLITLFLLQWLWDARSRQLPPWWSPLRTGMTMGAVIALAVALETALRL
ncbi:MAG: DUF3429 domain-containing protein [Caulobacteraceae bacterium]|nr:DUF3429 domain-containing protein [Caulobacteraceae bacterium]